MERRRFLSILGTTTAASVLPMCSSPARKNLPNIVLFFVDDMGYGDLGCYGHPTLCTPNIDRMAREGLRLTSFYVAAPSCTPSRAALLTGRYPLRCKLPHVLGPESKNGLPASEWTLAEALKKRGYRTAAIGKWHLGHAEQAFMPTSRGFDRYYGLLYSNDMIRPWVQTDAPLQLYSDTEPVESPVHQPTLTKRYTEQAVEFIKSAGDDPFFLYLPYSMVHLPVSASREFKGTSRAGLYGDAVEEIDWSVGVIEKQIDDMGQTGNTIFIFTSDNGPWCNMPPRMLQKGNEKWHAGTPGLLRGAKATTYEGGMRVPCIVRWRNRFPGGRMSAEIVTAMDLYTTLILAAGGNIPGDRTVDGNNVMDLFTGNTDRSPTRIFYYFNGENLEAVREDRWKLRITKSGGGTGTGKPQIELFDLEQDPGERYDMSGEHPEIVRELHEKMRGMARDAGASMTMTEEEKP